MKDHAFGAASAPTRRWTRFFAATGVVACLVAQSASSRAANPAPKPTAAAPGGYFLDSRDVSRIRGNLRRYAWAREAWTNTKSFANANLDTVASPPDPSGNYAASPPARPNWSDDLYGPGLRDGRAAFELALAYRISGDRRYAAAAKAILLRWVTVYAHPPGVGGGVAPGHMVAEPIGPMIKLFIAADLTHDTLAPPEARAVQDWARQWVAVGEANADSARDFAWVPDDTIGGFTSNQASYGNSALGQRAMALWAAAAAGPADLKRALAWNWSHMTRGGKPYGWSDLLDKLIIPGTSGETIEGRDRQSVGYGLFGWADLVLIAELAKHAGFKTNLFTYRAPSGNSLLSVGPFYGPIVGGTRTDPYPQAESLGGGGYAAVLSKYRAVFETVHVNCTAGTLCAPFGAALHAVSPATRGDDYDPHLLGWNALLGLN